MAVDITLLFKASVKTVKTRNKALGVPLGGTESGREDLLPLKRGGGPRARSEFTGRAREVLSSVVFHLPLVLLFLLLVLLIGD